MNNLSDNIASLALALLESEQKPLAIVHADLSIMWANPAANRLLQDSAVLNEREGRLYCEDPASHRKLVDFVDHVRNVTRDSLCLHRQSGRDFILLHAQLLCGGESAAALCIRLRDTDYEREIHFCDLHDAFGLTPREIEIVTSLAGGKTALEIAEALRMSIETTRTHIRNIYGKLDVGSREALLNLLAPFQSDA